MSNSDARLASRHVLVRKYLNHSERQRFLGAAAQAPEQDRLFAEVIAWTGARISEVLAIAPAAIDLDLGCVTLVTLKRRKYTTRDVPLPPALLRGLERHFALHIAQRDGTRADQQLFGFSRTTGWRIIKQMMRAARLVGPQATPRGLRHSFGVTSLQSGVPITLVKRWMGHSRLSTTEIYLDVMGPEEVSFAQLFWSADTRAKTAHAARRASSQLPRQHPLN
jgi:integrase